MSKFVSVILTDGKQICVRKSSIDVIDAIHQTIPDGWAFNIVTGTQLTTISYKSESAAKTNRDKLIDILESEDG